MKLFGLSAMAYLGKVSALLCAAVVPFAILAGCGGDTEGGSDTATGASATAPEQTDLKVGMLQVAGHVPTYAAQQLGYFEDEGLSVTFEFGAGGAAQLPLAIQGQLDIVNVPIATAIQARLENLDWVMLDTGTTVSTTSEPDQTGTIVATDSPIKSVADLEDKTIAVNTINSVNWLYNREMVSRAGVDPTNVEYTEVPFPNMLDAVANGSVDAAATLDPFLHIAVSSGKARVLAYDFLEVQPGVEISGFGAAREWADAHPNTVQAFKRAVDRAVEHLTQNEDEYKRLTVEFTGADPELIDVLRPYSFTTAMSEESIQKQMDLMLKHGMIEETIDLADLIWRPSE
jgi:NitT/TauT family transport system substrate-binding protein